MVKKGDFLTQKWTFFPVFPNKWLLFLKPGGPKVTQKGSILTPFLGFSRIFQGRFWHVVVSKMTPFWVIFGSFLAIFGSFLTHFLSRFWTIFGSTQCISGGFLKGGDLWRWPNSDKKWPRGHFLSLFGHLHKSPPFKKPPEIHWVDPKIVQKRDKKWVKNDPKMAKNDPKMTQKGVIFETTTCQNLPWKIRENPKKGVKIDPFWVTFGPPGFKNSSHLLGKTGKNVHFWVKKSPFLTIFWSFP